MKITYQEIDAALLAQIAAKYGQVAKEDLQGVSPAVVRQLRLIQAKSGVYVYRCMYDGAPAVVKYFENEGDRREILNYRLLAQHDIPTMKPLAMGTATLVLEDINASEHWRLGVAEDLHDTAVAKGLARWYFALHESSAAVSSTLFFEFDCITEENLNLLSRKLPEGAELFRFMLEQYGKFRELIYNPEFTLTYNDFYWTNFVVRKDKTAAMMFDYNLLGRGYRFSDFRNVFYSLSDEAGAVFRDEYNRLYTEKHGRARAEAEILEGRIDDVAGPLYALIVAFTERDSFPAWAEHEKNEAVNGNLLAKAKLLLSQS